MKKDRVPHALSHLYLHVILSSMTELVKIDPDTQTMIQGWNCCLDIGVMNHPPILLAISDNQIRLYSDAQSSPVIKLLTIGQEGIQPIWFEHAKEGCRGGQGIPPRSPDVKVNFTDMRTANEAFRNQIDTLAAVGAGRIKLEGLIPLADNLSLIMDRLDLYLQ